MLVVVKYSHVVGRGTPMNEAALVCVPPRTGGHDPTKIVCSNGVQTKAAFLFPVWARQVGLKSAEPIKDKSNDWQSASRVTRTPKYRKGKGYRQNWKTS